MTARGGTRATTRLTSLVALGLLVGCTTGSDPSDRTGGPEMTESTRTGAPTKSGTGEVRSDLAPLTDRFDALGDPVAATWASGTLGDDRVPGPSTYWIDAVVELEPAQAAALVEQYAPTPTQDLPQVVTDLDTSLPAGDLLAGDALDAAFTQDGFRADAYLDAAAGVLVLVAVGQ